MKQNIRTTTSWDLLQKSDLDKKRNVVFIDLFFSTTTLITAFDAGIKRAYLAGDLSSFLTLSNCYKKIALCSTEPGLFKRYIATDGAVRGFIHDFSTPLALSKNIGSFENLVLWSTNGTSGILSTAGQCHTLIGAMANLGVLTDHILNNKNNEDILLVCAGSNSKTSIEDLWCAGAYINSFLERQGTANFSLDNASRVALQLFLGMPAADIITKSPVAKLAAARGQIDEVLFCMKKDTSKNILIFDSNNSVQRH